MTFVVRYYDTDGRPHLVQDEEGTAIFQTIHTAVLVAAEFRLDYRWVDVLSSRFA